MIVVGLWLLLNFIMSFPLLLADSSSESSSSDEENLDFVLPEVLLTHPKNEEFVEHTVSLFTNQEFFVHFRVSKNDAENLAERYANSMHFPKYDTGFPMISAYKTILIFLWYAGHEAAGYRDVADRFNISISTLHTIIENVALFISNLSPEFIKWPTEAEKEEILQDFETRDFIGVLGCMDGCHIRIDKPSQDSESYLNRKKYYSIQVS